MLDVCINIIEGHGYLHWRFKVIDDMGQIIYNIYFLKLHLCAFGSLNV